MAETWNNHGHATRDGVVDHVDDVTTFAQPWSRLARIALLALSAVIGAVSAAVFAVGTPLDAVLLWVLLPVAFFGGLLSTWSPCGYSSVCLLRPSGAYSRASVMAWIPTLIAHAVGYTLGGVILGGALGFVGYALGLNATLAYTIPVFGVLLVLYGAHQFGFLNVPYPQRRCQVPHDARQRFPKWVVGLLYGFSLGLNYLTYVQTPLLYAVTGAALFSGSVTFAIGIFLVFNLGRFLPLVVNAFPVSDTAVRAEVDTLRGIERLGVAGGGVALVLDGYAGTVA